VKPLGQRDLGRRVRISDETPFRGKDGVLSGLGWAEGRYWIAVTLYEDPRPLAFARREFVFLGAPK
jgi:hypothetical protein